MASYWFLLPLCYLLGAIPFGWLVSKLVKGIDIREHGTRNLGASNVGSVVGTGWGLLVYILDILKGTIAGLIGQVVAGPAGLVMCGLAAIVGHDFPVTLGFRGGKGISTTTGVMWALDFRVAIVLYGTWFLGVIVTRHFILSSLLNFIVLTILAVVLRLSPWYAVFGVASGLLALQRHWNDLQRILRGEEPLAMASLAKHFSRN